MTWTSGQSLYHEGISKPLRPLSFDRANRGKPCRSPFPLFRLPIELLYDIAPHISTTDLETLALVDRDCRQLARSIQFVSVKLSYNDASLGLLETLLSELSASQDNHVLGPCIRRVTVDLGPPILDETRLARYPGLYGCLEGSPTPDNAQKAYIRAFSLVIRHSLPNLQCIDWQSRVELPAELIHSLVACSARHVNLTRGILCGPLDLFRAPVHWQLDSLVLDVEVDDHVSAVIMDMLRTLSPTLQHLHWRGARMPRHVLQTFGSHAPLFPCLRTVTLDAVPMADHSILSSFLTYNKSIRTLAVDGSDYTTAEFLGSCGCLPSLESFHWLNRYPAFEDDILQFIGANTQLHSLVLSFPLLPNTIESQILPAIASDFHNLTTLNLVWDSTAIPERSLHILGTLTQLKRLCISAGRQYGWCHDWMIEHDVLFDTLRPLRNLEELAFPRDSYQVFGHPLLDCSVEKYYVNYIFPRDLDFRAYLMEDEQALVNKLFGSGLYDMSFEQARTLQVKLMRAAWERWHQQRMVKLAQSYAATFPKLHWCYIGQYPMRIEEGRKIVIESAFRDDTIKSL